MDIAGLSVGLKSASTMSQVSIAVLSKAMDDSKALEKGLLEMIDAASMELSVNPGVGANFDVRV